MLFDEINPTAGAGAGTGTPDKPAEKQGIDKIVTDALNKTNEANKETLKDDKLPVKEANAASDKKDEKETEDDLTPDQLKYAKTLFKALANNDPKIQRQTLDLFARAAGLELKEIETKKEAIEAKETLLDLLKSGLGEYDFLADKLAPTLEKVFDKIISEKTADIRETVRLNEETRIKNEINTSIDSAFAKFSNSLDVKKEVLDLMDQFPKSDKVSYEKYFEGLIVFAANQKGVTLAKPNDKKTPEKDLNKVAKNREDAGSRISSDRTSEAKEGIKSSQRKSLDQSVREAAEEALKRMNA